jgi:hypothetical protein
MSNADMTVVIDTLLGDMFERHDFRTQWRDVRRASERTRPDWRGFRHEDVAAIRGYVRAIRVLRAAQGGGR